MLNGTDPKVGKSSIRQALEDAIVVGLISLVAGLITRAPEGPPDTSTLYAAGLAALLAGLIAYARARQIQLPPRS